MHDCLGMGIVKRIDGGRERVDESGGEGIGALRATDKRHLLYPGEGLQCGPGLLDSIVARATERAADDVDKAPNPFTSDILGDCFNLRPEDEAGEERRDLGMGIAHVWKFLILVG